MSYFVYVLSCSDHSLYAGYTSDLGSRLRQHNNGLGARYTRSRKPVELIGFWTFENRAEAMRTEARLKQLRRPEKLLLMHGEMIRQLHRLALPSPDNRDQQTTGTRVI